MKKTILFFLLSTNPLFSQYYIWYNYKTSDSIIIDTSIARGQVLSFIGEYKLSLKLDDEDLGHHRENATKEDSLYFNQFHPVDAIEYIVSRAKYEQVVMINEAHNQPLHRIFTTKLLQKLYDEGYRYFGGETLTHFDSILTAKKYPTYHSGYYTLEPSYGILLREAIRIGFTVFGYERKGPSNENDARMFEQAKNIKKILDKDPKAKILLHVGYFNFEETPDFMGGKFSSLTGINPLTIDQTMLSEHSSPEYEHAFYKTKNLASSSVFIDKEYQPLSLTNLTCDIFVYHPRSTFVNGRPNWYFENNRAPYFVNDKIAIPYPCLVFAYIAEEKLDVKNTIDTPIAFDIIELKNATDKKALSLKKGNFTIVVKSVSGQKQIINVAN